MSWPDFWGKMGKVIRSQSRDRYYLWALWFALALSSVVKWEPSGFDVMISVLLVVGIAFGYIKKIKSSLKIPLVFLGFFLAANIIGFVAYGLPTNALRFFAITFYCVLLWLFIVLIIDHFQDKGLNSILGGYTVSAVFSASIGIFAYIFMRNSMLIYIETRIRCFFKDPNVFGPYMIPIAIFSLAILLGKNNKKTWLWLVICNLCTVAVILSFSRGAWLNYAVSLVSLFILLAASRVNINRAVINQIVGGILIALIFFGLLYTSYRPFHWMVRHRFQPQVYDVQRFENYRQSIQISMANPMGIGPGQTLNELAIATHNTYLRVSLENGWLGLLAFLGFLLSSLIRSFRMARRKDTDNSFYVCITALLLGLMVNSLFIDTLHWRHFWLLLALAWVDYDQEPELFALDRNADRDNIPKPALPQ